MRELDYAEEEKNILEIYFEMQVSEKGASKNTVDAYLRDILDWHKFLCSQGRARLLTASMQEVSLYLKTLGKKKLSSSTVMRRLSAIRQLYAFLVREGKILEDPCRFIESPKKEKRLPRILNEQEVSALLDSISNLEAPEGQRLLCLMELLYATGLRVSELLQLTLASVQPLLLNVTNSILYVKGKGNKERIVPLSDPAKNSLFSYLKIRKVFVSSHGPSPWLFPSRSGKGHLTRQRFFQLLKALALQAGLDPVRVSPHVIRHAFATHMLNHGADLITLKKLLGHADISTTEIYTHVMHDMLEKTVFSYHPLSKNKKANNGNDLKQKRENNGHPS